MTSKQLKKVKAEMQKIIDRHLPGDQSFFIQNLDEEATFLLIDLLIEKDQIEREKIRAKIEENIKSNKMDIELTNEEIMKIKDKLDFLKNNFNNLNELKNIIDSDSELDNHLNNI